MGRAREQVDSGGASLEEVLQQLLLNYFILDTLICKPKKMANYDASDINNIRFVTKLTLRLMYVAVFLT